MFQANYYTPLPPLIPEQIRRPMMPPQEQYKATFPAIPIPQNEYHENKDSEVEDEIVVDDKSDLRERNRVAAQKWRKKKDNYLSDLEATNDQLRTQVFKLNAQAVQLTTENQVLENELKYFQVFVTKVMALVPK